MAHCPTPILVVSSSFNRGEIFATYDALAAGAVEVIEKPIGTEAPGVWEHQFLATLRIVSRVSVITHPRARLSGMTRDRSHYPPAQRRPALELAPIELVGVGASTGGPNALVQVLASLPKSFTLPVLAVLHIGAPFEVAFAEWLSSQIGRAVLHPRGGEALRSMRGRVALAPANSHLIVQRGRLVLSAAPERHSCRPSIDVLFESLAAECGPAAAGCLLTGMGRDGALGLLALKRAGAPTIAQDEATSVVYGMPREAALLGAADQILPLGEIGGAIAALGGAEKAT
jgi:two-component system chemotaxis response regulator CheB